MLPVAACAGASVGLAALEGLLSDGLKSMEFLDFGLSLDGAAL